MREQFLVGRQRRLLPWMVTACIALGLVPISGARHIATVVDPERTPVLVELYTSEGCSTCPPADDLLDDLLERQPIPGVLVVGLGEHVDYWNQLGWTDRFSSSAYSQRQRVYARNMGASEVYTPQVVINGTRQALGSDRSAVIHAISAAARETAATLTVSRTGGSPAKMQLVVTLSGAAHGATPELYAAVTDDQDTTMVGGGENGGHSLHYANTVRSMRSYGPIANGEAKALEIQMPTDSAKKKMHVVVFAQLANQGRVIAIASNPI